MPGLKIWYDGKIMLAGEATMPVTWVSPRLSSAVFDAMRAYWQAGPKALMVFRLEEHIRRFAQSLRFMQLNTKYKEKELVEYTRDMLRANGFKEDVLIETVAFLGVDITASGAPRLNLPPHIMIAPRIYPSTLEKPQTLDCMVSSWTRISDHQMPPRIKCIANYNNYRLASLEANRYGFKNFFSAIMLNQQGKVAEGAVSSLFMVKNNEVVTPPITADILEGITRATVMELCERELGMPVKERTVDRTELYMADELFFAGTSPEILSIASVDKYKVPDGAPGPVAKKLIRHFKDAVRGKDKKYKKWLLKV